MTISQLKALTASYFRKNVSDLTENGVDLFLLALNTVRLGAELNYDFEFTRRAVSVSVNGVNGGSLETAVLTGTDTPVKVKQVIDLQLKDTAGNLFPVEWTTKVESLQRMRNDMPYTGASYLFADDDNCGQQGEPRFEVSNQSIRHHPHSTSTESETVYLEAYVYSPDWTSLAEYVVARTSGESTLSTIVLGDYCVISDWIGDSLYRQKSAVPTDFLCFLHYTEDSVWAITYGGIRGAYSGSEADPVWINQVDEVVVGTYMDVTGNSNAVLTVTATGLDSTTDIWLTYGHEFLLWGVIVHLNHRFKEFVYRQEGNLMPPEKLAAVALENFKLWDSGYFEQHRRHAR